MRQPRFFVEKHRRTNPFDDYQHRCTTMPLLLEAVRYDRQTKRQEFIEVRARYAAGSRRVMELCLGDALDGEKPIQFGVDVAVTGSDRKFVIFSNDFSSVRYMPDVNMMAPQSPYQKDVVVILKQTHDTVRRFESIEANDILAVARLCCIFDLLPDEE